MNLDQIINGVIITKSCSIKPHKDSTERKLINLAIKFNGVMLGDVFNKAVSQAVIQWQNGPGRKSFDLWTDGQTVEIAFKAPGRQPQIEPEIAVKSRAKAINDRAERKRYINNLITELEALDNELEDTDVAE